MENSLPVDLATSLIMWHSAVPLPLVGPAYVFDFYKDIAQGSLSLHVENVYLVKFVIFIWKVSLKQIDSKELFFCVQTFIQQVCEKSNTHALFMLPITAVKTDFPAKVDIYWNCYVCNKNSTCN